MLPGALIVEAAAQLVRVPPGDDVQRGRRAASCGRCSSQIQRAKFHRAGRSRRPARDRRDDRAGTRESSAQVGLRGARSDGREAARGTLTFVLRSIDSPRVHEQRRYVYALWTREIVPAAGAPVSPGFAGGDRRHRDRDAPAMAAIRRRSCASARCASSWDGRTTWRSSPRPARSPLRRSRIALGERRVSTWRSATFRSRRRTSSGCSTPRSTRGGFRCRASRRTGSARSTRCSRSAAAQHAGLPRLAQLRRAGSLPRELSRAGQFYTALEEAFAALAVGIDRRRAGRRRRGSAQLPRRASLRPARPAGRRLPSRQRRRVPGARARSRRRGTRRANRRARLVEYRLELRRPSIHSPAREPHECLARDGVCLGQPQSLGPVSLPAALAGTTAARLAHRLQSRDGFDAASAWEVA